MAPIIMNCIYFLRFIDQKEQGITAVEEVSCQPSQFKCKDGACLELWQLCDGNADCEDNDDERYVRKG